MFLLRNKEKWKLKETGEKETKEKDQTERVWKGTDQNNVIVSFLLSTISLRVDKKDLTSRVNQTVISTEQNIHSVRREINGETISMNYIKNWKRNFLL